MLVLGLEVLMTYLMLMHWWILQKVSNMKRRAFSMKSSRQATRKKSFTRTYKTNRAFHRSSVKMAFQLKVKILGDKKTDVHRNEEICQTCAENWAKPFKEELWKWYYKYFICQVSPIFCKKTEYLASYIDINKGLFWQKFKDRSLLYKVIVI